MSLALTRLIHKEYHYMYLTIHIQYSGVGYTVRTCLVVFLTPSWILQSKPGPALQTCFPSSYSLNTGFPRIALFNFSKRDIAYETPLLATQASARERSGTPSYIT